jgi:hypothetical protein
MEMIKQLIFMISLVVASASVAGTNKTCIYTVPGRFGDCYHLPFTLNPENCELSIPTSERSPKHGGSNEYEFAEGGQFEVFIKKDAFPIPISNYKGRYLILRMPYTSSDQTNVLASLAEKRKLFDRIQKMKSDNKGSVNVIVELLREYIIIKKKKPLTIELEHPNIWFRDAYGKYIDYVGPLRKEDNHAKPPEKR